MSPGTCKSLVAGNFTCITGLQFARSSSLHLSNARTSAHPNFVNIQESIQQGDRFYNLSYTIHSFTTFCSLGSGLLVPVPSTAEVLLKSHLVVQITVTSEAPRVGCFLSQCCLKLCYFFPCLHLCGSHIFSPVGDSRVELSCCWQRKVQMKVKDSSRHVSFRLTIAQEEGGSLAE